MKKYYITGSSSGLGRAMVELLLMKEENRVIGISRSNNLRHPRFVHHKIDLSDSGTLGESFLAIIEPPGKEDKICLINNAGYLGPLSYAGELAENEIIRIHAVNLVAPAILSGIFIRKYREFEGEKVILNISSGASRRPYDGWSGYCSSKAGLDMLTRVLAVENEIRRNGFTIISLAPGIIDTAMQQEIREAPARNFSKKDRFVKLKTDKKLLTTEEAATNIIRFLENRDLHREPVQDIRDIY